MATRVQTKRQQREFERGENSGKKRCKKKKGKMDMHSIAQLGRWTSESQDLNGQ